MTHYMALAMIRARALLGLMACCCPFPRRPMGGNLTQALKVALADPPYQTKTDSVKAGSYEVVAKVLLAVKEADIERIVNEITLQECDVLMKYLYRGLGQPAKKHETYQHLLKWHPIVLKRAGQASIMRAISEVRETL
jgi:actin related protein 2/3 complex subunit 5